MRIFFGLVITLLGNYPNEVNKQVPNIYSHTQMHLGEKQGMFPLVTRNRWLFFSVSLMKRYCFCNEKNYICLAFNFKNLNGFQEGSFLVTMVPTLAHALWDNIK